jgi:outer membrane protein TolC
VQGAGPGGFYNAGVFGGGPDGGPHAYDGRADAELGMVWTLQNMGAGNRALVRERMAQEQRASIDFASVQDQVAQDVVQAHAVLEAATVQVQRAMTALNEAAITFNGTLKGIGSPLGGAVVQMANRPQEAVAALIQLNRAYGIYYAAVNDYNRAQFQLYRALGYPARTLVCDRPLGQVGTVDTTRPPGMAPVCQQQPCPYTPRGNK